MISFVWRSRRGQMLLLVVICAGLHLGIGLLSLMIGTPRVSPGELWIIANGGGAALPTLVVTQLRLPRFVLGTFAGSMLALSGALLQGALQNAPAGPELVGATACGTVVVSAITCLHPAVALNAVPVLSL